ncbi:hypothetical protein Cgig2_023150 [Carnegiea gigantea]|uniref:Uncharacterized protein n=1 Tax=Carnegiea gigantea TaxID=171969 RepID=A0A9Q1QHD7_9CARY|nr:hypothetical protein Cgig2_023150 [Carnegiea gigantea]
MAHNEAKGCKYVFIAEKMPKRRKFEESGAEKETSTIVSTRRRAVLGSNYALEEVARDNYGIVSLAKDDDVDLYTIEEMEISRRQCDERKRVPNEGKERRKRCRVAEDGVVIRDDTLMTGLRATNRRVEFDGEEISSDLGRMVKERMTKIVVTKKGKQKSDNDRRRSILQNYIRIISNLCDGSFEEDNIQSLDEFQVNVY